MDQLKQLLFFFKIFFMLLSLFILSGCSQKDYFQIKTSELIKKSYVMILLLKKVMDGKYVIIDFLQMAKLLKP